MADRARAREAASRLDREEARAFGERHRRRSAPAPAFRDAVRAERARDLEAETELRGDDRCIWGTVARRRAVARRRTVTARTSIVLCRCGRVGQSAVGPRR